MIKPYVKLIDVQRTAERTKHQRAHKPLYVCVFIVSYFSHLPLRSIDFAHFRPVATKIMRTQYCILFVCHFMTCCILDWIGETYAD